MLRWFLSILFIFPCFVFGQSFTVFNYSVPDGLPSSEVYEIYQDKEGFMWFATDNGVTQYDGSEFHNYHLKDGLSDPVVFGFQEDEKNRLWFRTYSGKLCYRENGTFKKYAFNDLLSSIARYGILDFNFESSTGDLWFGVWNIHGRIDSTGNLYADTLLSHEFQHSSVVHRNIGDRNVFIKVAPHTNSLFIQGRKYPVAISDSTFWSRTTRHTTWNNKIYIGLYSDIFEFDGTMVKKVYAAKYPIISLTVDAENQLWVGYLSGGTERFQSDAFNDPWSPPFLAERSVTHVFQNRINKAFWFSTLENGVYTIPNSSIQNFTLPGVSKITGIEYFNGRMMIGDRKGTLWSIGMNPKKMEQEQKFDRAIVKMLPMDDDLLFLSTQNTIHILDQQLQSVKHYRSHMAIDAVPVNHSVWSYGGNKFLKFNQKGDLIHRQFVTGNECRSIVVDDSIIYCAGRMGLQTMTHSFEPIEKLEEFKDFKITKITPLNDSLLMLSSVGNGFVVYNKTTGQSRYYSEHQQFVARNIYSVLKRDSLLWIATESGIAITSLSSLIQNKPRFRYHTKKTGLLSDRIIFLTGTTEHVWAFSDEGYSLVPDTVGESQEVPKFYIKQILINDTPVSVDSLQHLSHELKNISVDFGFIAYHHNQIFVRHRIAPSDPWNYSGSRSLQFSSLAPGSYALEVEYTTDNIRWMKAGTNVSFRILPPWWNRWYSYAGFITLLLVAGYLYFRYQRSLFRQRHHYLQIINEHQQKLIQSEIVTLERERNRIAKELHDGVGTNLTAIKLMVNQLLERHREPMAEEVEEQFQATIHEIKEIIYDLTPPTLGRYGLFTALRNYIEKLNKSIPLTLSLKTFGNESNRYELNILVFRIVQELISNSIKHSRATEVTLHINVFDDVMNIVFDDNGIGFTVGEQQEGLGLDNIESRIHAVNGTCKFESGPFGSSYTIDIPLSPLA